MKDVEREKAQELFGTAAEPSALASKVRTIPQLPSRPSPSLSKTTNFSQLTPVLETDPRHQIPHLRHPRLLPRQRRRQHRRQIIPRQAHREREEEGGGLDQECEKLAGDCEAGEGVE